MAAGGLAVRHRARPRCGITALNNIVNQNKQSKVCASPHFPIHSFWGVDWLGALPLSLVESRLLLSPGVSLPAEALGVVFELNPSTSANSDFLAELGKGSFALPTGMPKVLGECPSRRERPITHRPILIMLRQKHQKYCLNLEKNATLQSIGYFLTEHLRVSGCYWTLGALAAMDTPLEESKRVEIRDWLKTCHNKDGGFGGNSLHDSHITNTHYAVLSMLMLGCLDQLDCERIVDYVVSMANPDGSFKGDCWGEVDTRFSYCAVSCLTLLGKAGRLDKEAIISHIMSCLNFDGSFGGIPGAQSHAAYVFCCVGTLKILDTLDRIDTRRLSDWLLERQTSKGGFNGRPEKLPDVCYSWWIYSSLCMMGQEHVIDKLALEKYILECQDAEDGGISDRPGNTADVFHTFFGLAALSLLRGKDLGLVSIDPTFALPVKVLPFKL